MLCYLHVILQEIRRPIRGPALKRLANNVNIVKLLGERRHGHDIDKTDYILMTPSCPSSLISRMMRLASVRSENALVTFLMATRRK